MLWQEISNWMIKHPDIVKHSIRCVDSIICTILCIYEQLCFVPYQQCTTTSCNTEYNDASCVELWDYNVEDWSWHSVIQVHYKKVVTELWGDILEGAANYLQIGQFWYEQMEKMVGYQVRLVAFLSIQLELPWLPHKASVPLHQVSVILYDKLASGFWNLPDLNTT